MEYNKGMVKFISGIVLGILIVGAVWFWFDSEKAAAPIPPPNWEDVTAQIKSALVADGQSIEERAPIRIMEKKDITGDGINEAVVDTGSGGAYTVYKAVLQMKNREPALVRIKDKDGKTFALSGWPVGASAMHGTDIELLPEQNAIALGTYALDGRTADIKLDECRNEIYVWSESSELFEWNSELSQSSSISYCAKVEERIR